jgi:hypothetical protein
MSLRGTRCCALPPRPPGYRAAAALLVCFGSREPVAANAAVVLGGVFVHGLLLCRRYRFLTGGFSYSERKPGREKCLEQAGPTAHRNPPVS